MDTINVLMNLKNAHKMVTIRDICYYYRYENDTISYTLEYIFIETDWQADYQSRGPWFDSWQP